MRTNKLQSLLEHGKKFVLSMDENNIPKDLQRAMFKAYITGYIVRHKYKIKLTEDQITELVG